SIMVGGREADYERASPVLRVLGTTVVRVGGVGAGNHAKLANQILVGVVLAGMGEALVYGAKAGVRLDALLDVLKGGLAPRVPEVKGPKVIRGDFRPGGKADFHLKDLNNALRCARELGLELRIAELVRGYYLRLSAAGRGGEDHSAVIRITEAKCGVEARLGSSGDAP
ncbi:MAG: NAD-binding protein, partial [Planctomycetes bacterium]|nr:NAD-binding protein [Planctomycetota bacterium]